MKLFNTLIVITSLFLLTSCLDADSESDVFFKKIQAAFEAGKNEVYLTDIFSKEIDELCILLPDSSMPKEAVKWVGDLQEEKNISGDFIYKKHFAIFLAIKDGRYKSYSQWSSAIFLNGKKYWLSSDGVPSSQKCVKSSNGAFQASYSLRNNIYRIKLIEKEY